MAIFAPGIKIELMCMRWEFYIEIKAEISSLTFFSFGHIMDQSKLLAPPMKH